MSHGPDDRVDAAMRWRLVLGRFAEDHLPLEDAAEGSDGGNDLAGAVEESTRLDGALQYIYDREFAKRAHRDAGPGTGDDITIPAWLRGVKELFPEQAVHVMERDALTRYGMTELVTDAELLRRADPTPALLKAILQFKHLMKPEVLEVARQVVREVVEQLSATIRRACEPALWGAVGPGEQPPPRTFRNVDWHRTIQRNLKHWDTDNNRIVTDRMSYRRRQRSRQRWRIIVAVDQSGSMLDSLIHSAIMAAIFTELSSVRTHLVLWDHRVMDVSDLAHDPLEVLMSCQLGGGTRLHPALRHCAGLVTEPERTILVVVSDWYVFDEAEVCLELAADLATAGVRGIGLCALDGSGRPAHDERFARALANAGWFVAALTPQALAEHVGRVLG